MPPLAFYRSILIAQLGISRVLQHRDERLKALRREAVGHEREGPDAPRGLFALVGESGAAQRTLERLVPVVAFGTDVGERPLEKTHRAERVAAERVVERVGSSSAGRS